MKTKRQPNGQLMILIASLLWSTAGLFIKFIPWNGPAIASIRSLFAASFFYVLFHNKINFKPNKYTLISAIALMFTQVAFISATKITTATNAVMLQYSAPIFVMLILWLKYKKPPKKLDAILLSFALVGISLFFADGITKSNIWGDLLALSTGFSFALVFIMNARDDCNSFTAMFLGQVISFLIALPMGFHTIDLQLTSWIAIILMGVFQLSLAYAFFNKGIRSTPPIKASIITMVEPVMNPVWVFLFIGEIPSIMAIIGGSIVVCCILLQGIIRRA